MNSAFRILVFAVATLAVIWLFLTVFAPLFAGPSQVIETIERGLQTAKAQVGQSTSIGTLDMLPGTTLTKTSFGQEKTDIVFECNSPLDCCDKGAACDQKAVWNEERISFDRAERVRAFARCQFEFEFFACKIFFGHAPAQVAIVPASIPTIIDLRNHSTLLFSTTVQNRGEEKSLEGIVEVLLQEKTRPEQSLDFQTVYGQQQPLPEITAGQATTLTWVVPLTTSGEYQLVLQTRSENAGADRQTHEFKAINEPNSCQALANQPTQKQFDAQTGLCTQQYFCANCSLAIDCKAQWQLVQPQTAFEIGDPTFAERVFVSTLDECQ